MEESHKGALKITSVLLLQFTEEKPCVYCFYSHLGKNSTDYMNLVHVHIVSSCPYKLLAWAQYWADSIHSSKSTDSFFLCPRNILVTSHLNTSVV